MDTLPPFQLDPNVDLQREILQLIEVLNGFFAHANKSEAGPREQPMLRLMLMLPTKYNEVASLTVGCRQCVHGAEASSSIIVDMNEYQYAKQPPTGLFVRSLLKLLLQQLRVFSPDAFEQVILSPAFTPGNLLSVVGASSNEQQ